MNKFIKEFLIVLAILVYMTLVATGIFVMRILLGDTVLTLALSVIAISLSVALFMTIIDKVEF